MKLRAAVCGYGPMGRMHTQLLARQEGVDLVGVADVEESMRVQAGAEHNVPTWPSGEAMIDAGIADVIFVCVPTYLHAALSLRALDAGCHVFCEKPMALNPRECDTMIAAAQRSGRLLTVGQVLRFWPEYVYLKQAVDSGAYGRLETLSLVRVGGVSVGWQRWFLDEARGGTQIFDRHIHDSDLCLWLLGKPAAVRTFGTFAAEGGCVHCFTRYEYPGVAVSAEGGADMPAGFPFTMGYTAVFEQASIQFSSRSKPTLALYPGDGSVVHPEPPNPLGEIQTGLNISSAGGYHLEQVYFLDCIRGGRTPEIVTPESARDTVDLVRREVRSAKSGRRVALP